MLNFAETVYFAEPVSEEKKELYDFQFLKAFDVPTEVGKKSRCFFRSRRLDFRRPRPKGG